VAQPAGFTFLTKSHGMQTASTMASVGYADPSLKGALNLFARVAAFRLFALLENSENSGGTASFHAVLWSHDRRRPRVSAENEVSLADNLLEITARTAKKRHPALSPATLAGVLSMRHSDRQCGITSLANRVIDRRTMSWSMMPP
jgi:hypothetical protein